MDAGRTWLRAVMALVGLSLLAFYVLVAYLGYRAVVLLQAAQPDPVSVLALVTGTTLLFGYLSYRFGTRQLPRRLDAVEPSRVRAPALYRRLDRLCERMDVAEPRILVARFPTPNALSLGGARRGTVVIDRSLFRLLDADELEGLLAHELAHLESHDALVQTLAYSAIRTVAGLLLVVLSPFLLVAAGLAQAVAWIRGRPGSWPSTVFGRVRLRLEQGVMLVLSVITLAVLALSRRREYAADDRAASVTGKPLALARALRKIQRTSEPRWGLLSLLYVHTEETDRWRRLFSTHPSTDDRIERLVERANAERIDGRRRISIR